MHGGQAHLAGSSHFSTLENAARARIILPDPPRKQPTLLRRAPLRSSGKPLRVWRARAGTLESALTSTILLRPIRMLWHGRLTDPPARLRACGNTFGTFPPIRSSYSHKGAMVVPFVLSLLLLRVVGSNQKVREMLRVPKERNIDRTIHKSHQER